MEGGKEAEFGWSSFGELMPTLGITSTSCYQFETLCPGLWCHCKEVFCSTQH